MVFDGSGWACVAPGLAAFVLQVPPRRPQADLGHLNVLECRHSAQDDACYKTVLPRG